jgi:hypothetical protein
MSQGHEDPPEAQRRSSIADAAAVRWYEEHPEEDAPYAGPARVPDGEGGVRERRSASAEAAALRFREWEDEDDDEARRPRRRPRGR